jgi:hypothetical protein
MLLRESRKLRSIILNNFKLKKFDNLRLVVIGSGDTNFRQTIQPQIHKNIYEPFENDSTIKILSIDIKSTDDTELHGDILNLGVREAELIRNADIYLVSNLIEHVRDIRETFRIIAGLMGNQSVLICSGPVIYPYHPDPIDNMFRPKTRQDFRKWIGDLNIEEFKVYSNGMNIFSDAIGFKKSLIAIYFGLKHLFVNPRKISVISHFFKSYSYYIAVIKK